jgi:hypothetical protein
MSCKSPEARRRENRRKYEKGKLSGRFRKHKVRQKKASRERNRRWLGELKKDLRCVRCGFSHPAALDFHHIGKKSGAISRMALTGGGVSALRVRQEIAKCEVLCANCHRIEHSENGYGGHNGADVRERHPEFEFSYLKEKEDSSQDE